MTSRLSLILSMLAVLLITLSGCAGATPTLDPTATNPPNPTSTPTETPSPPAELPTPTPSETPIPLPTLDLDIDVPLIDVIDNLPENALARFGISGSFVQFVPFPDHSGIILWSTTGVYAYRLPGFEPLWRQYLNPAPNRIKVSEDSSLVTAYVGVSDSCGIDAFVFDAETGQLVEQDSFGGSGTWTTGVGSIQAIEREPEEVDGEFVPVIEVYDDDVYLGRLDVPTTLSFASLFTSLSYISPDGQYVAVDMFGENTLYMFQLPSLELLYSLNYPDDNQWGAFGSNPLFSVDGKYISYIGEKMRLNVLLAETGEQVYQSEMTVSQYLWTPNALLLANDLSLFRVIAIDDWSEVYFQERVTNARFDLSPDGKQIAVGYSRGIMAFDAESLEFEYDIPGVGNIMWPEDSDLLIGNYNTLVDRGSGEPLFTPLDDATIGVVEGGKVYLLVDDRLLIVDLAQEKAVDGVRYSIEPESMQWAVDEDALIIETESGTWLWSETTNDLRLIETPPEAQSRLTEFGSAGVFDPAGPYPSPDGEIYALAVNDGYCADGPCSGGCGYNSSALQLYQGEDEEPFAEYSFNLGVTTMAWSSDGELMALGHPDRISIIDPDTGETLQMLEGHTGEITGLLFSPDGSRLASTSWDGTIIIWSIGDA